MKRIIFAVFLAILIGGIAIGYYMYNKPHVNVKESKVDITTTVDAILNEFTTDQGTALAMYADKVVLLSGTFGGIANGDGGSVTIIIKGTNGLANCEMDTQYSSNMPSFLAVDDKITVKGLFVGYDDLLGELQFKKCTISE